MTCLQRRRCRRPERAKLSRRTVFWRGRARRVRSQRISQTEQRSHRNKRSMSGRRDRSPVCRWRRAIWPGWRVGDPTPKITSGQSSIRAACDLRGRISHPRAREARAQRQTAQRGFAGVPSVFSGGSVAPFVRSVSSLPPLLFFSSPLLSSLLFSPLPILSYGVLCPIHLATQACTSE
jgi:hypothetical protein